jgi:hypothetical protein
MTDKEYIKQAKLACKAEAQKHLDTLSGSWKFETHDEIFADYFSWHLYSKDERVLVYKWHSNNFRAEMGKFSAIGKTAKSAIRNLKDVVNSGLNSMGAQLTDPFPVF